MDTMWALRSAYAEALQHKNLQDGFCAKAQAGLWTSLPTEFPQSVKWELLTKVLRGKVKVSNLRDVALNRLIPALGWQVSVHCNEAVDLDGMVRVSTSILGRFP